MRSPRCVCILLTLLCGIQSSATAQPADGTATGDLLIDRYLRLETAKLNQRFLDSAQTKEEWEQRRPKLKEQYLEMLGLWPLPERTPLNAKVTGTLERDAFSVEKVHFQSKPGLYVTGNLYLPKASAKAEKFPAVLYVCGHSGRGRDGNKTAFQHHGMWFATHGYVCLIIDTLQLGEIPGIHHGTYREGRWWWQSMGYTPAGVECWNGIRAIDYLQGRPEVDPEKIAVTGISGGGASTLWIAAADDRVKVAVPVSGVSDLESYVSGKVINGHCDCMFMVNTYHWEWTTLLAMIAPRPLLFLNSGHDRIFPMSANDRIRARMEMLYRLYNPKPEELFDIGVTPGDHNDNLELRLMAYRWINRYLKKDNAEVQEPLLPRFVGKELRVFPEDKDLPTDGLNSKIDESFVQVLKPPLPTDGKQLSRWREDRLSQLRAKVFREWPDQVHAAEPLQPAGKGKHLLATEPGIAVTAFTASNPAKPERITLLVLDSDEPEDKLPAWAKGLTTETDKVVLLSPRGCGGLAWSRKSPPNYVDRAHALLGRTVDTGRVWDVQATARWLHEHDEASARIQVAGRGQAGILAAYAALFDPCIQEVTVVDPPASHREGPTLLNVLRVVDIPETLGMLAPVTLTLVNARDKTFEQTVQVYKAAGAEDNLNRR